MQVWNFLQESKKESENGSMIIMALMKVHFAQLWQDLIYTFFIQSAHILDSAKKTWCGYLEELINNFRFKSCNDFSECSTVFSSLKVSLGFSQCRNLIFDEREQEQTNQKSSSHEKTRRWLFRVWAFACFRVDALEGHHLYVQWCGCPWRPFLRKSLRKRWETLRKRWEAMLAARKQSPHTGYCWKRKLRGKCEWNRWFAISLAWSNPPELPGQQDSEQINYFIQTQRCSGRVFRCNTVRGMKREEVVANIGHEKRYRVFS